MRSRTFAAVLLNIGLVTVSTFYFFAPTVYTFFSEAQLSYANVPKWFATTAPARMTARFFDHYNATAPRAARFQRQLSCFLIDEGATRHPGCLHEVRSGQVVHGPELLKIASGLYVAHFEFSENDVCSDGDVRLQVVTAGRFGRVLADYSGHITPGQVIDLPFQLKLMDAALGAVEFRATGLDRCVLLQRAGWTPPITAG